MLNLHSFIVFVNGLILRFFFPLISFVYKGIEGIGVNYGLLGNNLPPPDQVIALLKSRGIHKIRIFEPNQDVLQALHNSQIDVIVGVRNEDLQQLAENPSYATEWVNNNLVPHASSVTFTFVSAGNEVIPGPLAGYVLGAMKNLDSAIRSANIVAPVTTVVSMSVLSSSYPPSSGIFTAEILDVMTSIASFLTETHSPLLVNVYPYFSYVSDPANVKLEFALFQGTEGVQDGAIVYHSLFDAMVDAIYAALEKVGGSRVGIIVSETGWPSAGNGDATTKEKAATYVNNLVGYIGSGNTTLKGTSMGLEAYVFAIFNENLKPGGVEQNWGLYYPDMTEVYHVNF